MVMSWRYGLLVHSYDAAEILAPLVQKERWRGEDGRAVVCTAVRLLALLLLLKIARLWKGKGNI